MIENLTLVGMAGTHSYVPDITCLDYIVKGLHLEIQDLVEIASKYYEESLTVSSMGVLGSNLWPVK